MKKIRAGEHFHKSWAVSACTFIKNKLHLNKDIRYLRTSDIFRTPMEDFQIQ